MDSIAGGEGGAGAERIARLNSGGMNAGANPAEAAGEVMGSQDVRGP